MPNYAKHMKLKGENEGLRQQLAECRARNADLDRELEKRGQEMEQINSVENLLHCQLDHADGRIIDLTSCVDALRQQLTLANSKVQMMSEIVRLAHECIDCDEDSGNTELEYVDSARYSLLADALEKYGLEVRWRTIRPCQYGSRRGGRE